MDAFSLFGTEHIIWLIACAVLLLLSLTASRGSAVFVRAVAVIAVSFHLIQCAFRIYEGSYDLYTLPIHICAISSYFTLIHALTGSAIIGEILFFPGLPGAICALIWPDWTMYRPFGVLSITGFLSHIAIVIYVLTAIRAGMIRPSLKKSYIPVMFIALYSVLIIPFDKHFHANYGFLNVPSPGSVLEIIAKIFGST